MNFRGTHSDHSKDVTHALIVFVSGIVSDVLER